MHPGNDLTLDTQAKEQALKWLDVFPGDTIVKKTSYVTIGASITAILAAKDIYIANKETLILAAFVILMRIAYIKLGPLVSEFAENGMNVSVMCFFYSLQRHFVIGIAKNMVSEDYRTTPKSV
jgi:Mitochondrial ATP synthase B chain precursor (ATP-synt_B)